MIVIIKKNKRYDKKEKSLMRNFLRKCCYMNKELILLLINEFIEPSIFIFYSPPLSLFIDSSTNTIAIIIYV